MTLGIDKKTFNVFKEGSITFFYSTLFFPSEYRRKVFDFYEFVRIYDNLCDLRVPEAEKYYKYKQDFYSTLDGKKSLYPFNENLISLIQETDIKHSWLQAFFTSMEMDLDNKEYKTYKDLSDYIYGSAEVIGLCMCAILEIDKKAYDSAKHLGHAFQLINMTRDIWDDFIQLGRIYFPKEDMLRFNIDLKLGINNLFWKDFIDFELKRFYKELELGKQGLRFIPPIIQGPILTAINMYEYTARKIQQNPTLVFTTKVKPSKSRVVATALRNLCIKNLRA